MKRKHVANGRPNGGKREGAGRKPGSTNALSLGEVQAIRAANHRIPESAPQAIKDLANKALEVIANVMTGAVYSLDAPTRLKAAGMMREEACGRTTQSINVAGADGGPLVVKVLEYYGDEEDDAAPVSEPGKGEP